MNEPEVLWRWAPPLEMKDRPANVDEFIVVSDPQDSSGISIEQVFRGETNIFGLPNKSYRLVIAELLRQLHRGPR
jgi:hypothetical protein